jgi:hypothetical protein
VQRPGKWNLSRGVGDPELLELCSPRSKLLSGWTPGQRQLLGRCGLILNIPLRTVLKVVMKKFHHRHVNFKCV